MNVLITLLLIYQFPDSLSQRERHGYYAMYSHYVPEGVEVSDYGQNRTSDNCSLLSLRSDDFLINDDDYPYSGAMQYFSDAAADGQGKFWIVWCDARNGDYDIYLVHCDASGNQLGPNIRVNEDQGIYLQRWPAVSANGSSAVVAWYASIVPLGLSYSPGDVYYQRFDVTGNRIGANIQVNDIANSASGEYANPIDVAVNNNGDFVISWVDRRNI
jgi:hypothetical protein